MALAVLALTPGCAAITRPPTGPLGGTPRGTSAPPGGGIASGGLCRAAVPGDNFSIAAHVHFPVADTEVTTQDLGAVDRAQFARHMGSAATAQGLRSLRLSLSEQDIVLTYVPTAQFPPGESSEVIARFPRGGFVGPVTPSAIAPLLSSALAENAVDLTTVRAEQLTLQQYLLPQPPEFDLSAFAATYPQSKFTLCGEWNLDFPIGWAGPRALAPTAAEFINLTSDVRIGFGDGKFVVERLEAGGQTVTDWYAVPGLHVVPMGSRSPDRDLAIALATTNTPLRSVASADWTPPMQPDPSNQPWLLMGTDAHGAALAAWVWESHDSLQEAYAYLNGGISADQAVSVVQALGYQVRTGLGTAPALVDPADPAWYVPVWHSNGWGYILVDRVTGKVRGQSHTIRFTGQN